MREYLEDSLFLERSKNAAASWLILAYLLITSVNILLDGNLLWSIYSISVILLVTLPVVFLKERDAMVPFEILLLLAIPFTLKGVEAGFVASHTLSYISAAAVSLVIISELDTFTSFRTTHWFSVYLVAVTTVAMAGVWSVARWLSDTQLGTAFITSEHVLMWEFTAALLAGLIAGKIFGSYFRKRESRLKNEAS